MKILSNKYLLFVFRLAVGFVLIIAAIPKIADPSSFAKSIEAYQLIPTILINLTALLIPWAELLIGIFLIVGVMLRGSAILSASLFAAFSIIIAVSLLRGLTIDCGCFGPNSSPLSWMRFWEDIGLMLFTILIYHTSKNKLKYDQKNLSS
ncbi:MAG: MauE/DoxX family redox-associated membrane protein [Bacteroidota bacterium]|nr:MauE/DoxX family redox-associated membrane protein [Bacteroidota bacterium]